MTSNDDWDSHWVRFSQASEVGPTPGYRHKIVHDILWLRPNRTMVPNPVLLDIGCGTGDFAEYLSTRSNCYYYGTDTSKLAIDLAKSRNIKNAIFTTSPESLSRFGLACCCEVVEHLNDPVSFLQYYSGFMRSGCRFVVTAPGGPMNEFYRVIGHRRHYSPEELKQLLLDSGFEVWGYWGYGFPFFNLFRVMLSVMGRSVVKASTGKPSIMVRLISFVFSVLFKFNLPNLNGWQSVVLAVKK